MRILLVEPDRLLARSYMLALRTAGYQVSVAATAQSAIHAADEHRPDLVILELQLVSHSGIEFLYEFRSYTDWQTIPVVVLSLIPPAEFTDSRQLLFRELGVAAYYYKPQTTLAALLQGIRSLVVEQVADH